MKVLFINHTSELGGAELGLARYLEHPSAHERSLLLFASGALEQRLLAHEFRDVRVFPQPTNPLGPLWRRRAFARTVEQGSPDVIVTNSLRSALTVALARVRVPTKIAYVREDLSRESKGLFKRTIYTKFALRTFDALFANSQYTADSLAQTVPSVPIEIAYPVSAISSETDPAEGVVRSGADRPPLRVLSLSRLHPTKGIHLLLEAAAMLQSASPSTQLEVTVAGGGTRGVLADPAYEQRLRSFARDHDLRVTFVDHVSDVAPLIDQCDVLALCSTAPEAFGQVLPQAMARSRVVVAPAHGGPTEIIRNRENGILTQPNSVDSLADALRELAQSPNWRVSLGVAAAKASRRFDDAHTVRALDDAIDRIHRRR